MMDEKRITEVLKAYLRGEWPPEVAIATAPRLANWKVSVVQSVVDDAFEMRLIGTVTGHAHLPDGDEIHTSPLIWIDPDRRLAHTMSRLYSLGDPTPERSR